MNCCSRREDYGYARLKDSDCAMTRFLASGKKQIVYWAEEIKTSGNQPYMTYDTFKTRVREYLRRTNQVLSASQVERICLPDREIHQYAQLYLRLAPMNKAQFFEEYVIVPPYDTVPASKPMAATE